MRGSPHGTPHHRRLWPDRPGGGPEYNEVRIGNLEQRVRELIAAVGELQHRLGKVDGGELAWPGDTYEPPDLPPEIFRD